MIEPIHSRQESWEGWPFGSIADAAEFVGELVAMVEEAAGSAPHLSTTVKYEDRQYELHSVGELRELAPDLHLADMHELSVMVFWSWGDPRPVTATFNLDGGAYHCRTRLSVSGTKGTAVDGVNVGATASVERRVEKAREREREAVEDKAVEAAEAQGVDVEAQGVDVEVNEPPPVWRRFFNHQYSVQIIGGAVGSVIAALVLLLVLQQS